MTDSGGHVGEIQANAVRGPEPYAILVRPDHGRLWRMEILTDNGQILDYTLASRPRLAFAMALRSFKALRSGKRKPRS